MNRVKPGHAHNNVIDELLKRSFEGVANDSAVVHDGAADIFS